jgi:hypothetical protein
MTPKQLQLIHTAARSLGIEEGEYRLILLNIGHVHSSKDLTQVGLEDVMAHFEERGFRQNRCGRIHPFYWRQIRDNRIAFADSRQVHMIGALHAELEQGYTLEGLCMRHTHGRTDRPEKLTPREASNLIEALKAMKARADAEPDALQPVGAETALGDEDIPF